MFLYLIIALCLFLLICSWRQNRRINHEVMNDVTKFDRIISSDLVNLFCSSAVLVCLIFFLQSFGNSDLDAYEQSLNETHEVNQKDEYKRLLKSLNSINEQTKVLIINGSDEGVNLDLLKTVLLDEYELNCDVYKFEFKPEEMRLPAKFIDEKFEEYDVIISYNFFSGNTVHITRNCVF